MFHSFSFLSACATAGLATATLLFTGCGGDSEAATPTVVAAPTPAVDWQSYHLTEAPAASHSIVDAKRSVRPGEQVTIRGRIGGRRDPFVAGKAAFLLTDGEHVQACDAMGDDDHCSTPWDYCCEPRQKRAEAAAMVQIVDGEGFPMNETLNGVNGLAAGQNVVVVGTVAPGSNGDMYVVQAQGIYQQP